jgi:hypothetical protein
MNAGADTIGSTVLTPAGGDHEIREGLALYQTFQGFAPERVRTVRHHRLMPPVVAELGELVGLIYRSDKGRPGRPSTYIHFMESPPVLASNPSGSQLYLIGGNYRVTGRGIEG